MKKSILLLLFLPFFVLQGKAQPAADAWNGVCMAVKEYMKENANDPKSIKYAECSYILKFKGGTYGQRVKYRGANAFGGTVLNENLFIISGEGYNAKVIGVLSMADATRLLSTTEGQIIAKYDSSGKLVQ